MLNPFLRRRHDCVTKQQSNARVEGARRHASTARRDARERACSAAGAAMRANVWVRSALPTKQLIQDLLALTALYFGWRDDLRRGQGEQFLCGRDRRHGTDDPGILEEIAHQSKRCPRCFDNGNEGYLLARHGGVELLRHGWPAEIGDHKAGEPHERLDGFGVVPRRWT